MSKTIAVTIPDKDLIWWQDFTETARREGSVSAVLVALARDYVVKHKDSKNPQTEITQFRTTGIAAIPNIYEIAEHPEKLEKFYGKMTKREDYTVLDAGVNELWRQHNRHFKKMKVMKKW